MSQPKNITDSIAQLIMGEVERIIEMDNVNKIDQYPTLTDTQRIQARKHAETNILQKYGRKPNRADFSDYSQSRFPRWFTISVALALAFVALSAGLISAFRLYYAGYDHFYAAVQNETLATIVGVLTPLAAEVLVIVAAVSLQVYMHTKGKARWIALVPVFLGTLVAFVGNWQITQPDSTWGYVETIFPPIAVLSVAFFFEGTLVPELERRQQNENAYKEARAEYDLLTRNPDKHPQWQNTYGWSLWEMWAKVYGSRYDAATFDREFKQQIAIREMNADTFFDSERNMPRNMPRNMQRAYANRPSGGDRNNSYSSMPEHMRGKTKKEIVLEYVAEYPEAASMDQRELADLLTDLYGTSITQPTISKALRSYTNGNGRRG